MKEKYYYVGSRECIICSREIAVWIMELLNYNAETKSSSLINKVPIYLHEGYAYTSLVELNKHKG